MTDNEKDAMFKGFVAGMGVMAGWLLLSIAFWMWVKS